MGTNMRTIRTLVLLGNMACARRRRSCMLDGQSGFGVLVLGVTLGSPVNSGHHSKVVHLVHQVVCAVGLHHACDLRERSAVRARNWGIR